MTPVNNVIKLVRLVPVQGQIVLAVSQATFSSLAALAAVNVSEGIVLMADSGTLIISSLAVTYAWRSALIVMVGMTTAHSALLATSSTHSRTTALNHANKNNVKLENSGVSIPRIVRPVTIPAPRVRRCLQDAPAVSRVTSLTLSSSLAHPANAEKMNITICTTVYASLAAMLALHAKDHRLLVVRVIQVISMTPQARHAHRLLALRENIGISQQHLAPVSYVMRSAKPVRVLLQLV